MSRLSQYSLPKTFTPVALLADVMKQRYLLIVDLCYLFPYSNNLKHTCTGCQRYNVAQSRGNFTVSSHPSAGLTSTVVSKLDPKFDPLRRQARLNVRLGSTQRVRYLAGSHLPSWPSGFVSKSEEESAQCLLMSPFYHMPSPLGSKTI